MNDSDVQNSIPPDRSIPAELDDEQFEQIQDENEALLQEFFRERDTPLIEDELPDNYRSGYTVVMGKPNVGKSTLMNVLLGEKLAIVTPKPQTTRDNQLGILTTDDYQIVFVDTPGIHSARNKLGEFMVDTAQASVPDADVVLFIVDISEHPTDADRSIADLLLERNRADDAILVMNKSDLVDGPDTERNLEAYRSLLPGAKTVKISALDLTNVDELLGMIVARLPEGPRYYPADVITETHIRDNASEIIREKVLLQYEQEVPHAVAVKIDEFKRRDENMTYIAATIYVERDSQKAILIGKGGRALKQLGREARKDLQQLIGTRVYLDLWVKLLKNWRKDESALKRLGFDRKS